MRALSRRHRALSLVPVAMLTAAWTSGSEADAGARDDRPVVSASPVAVVPAAVALPDVAPASLTAAGGRSRIASSAAALAVPDVALAAYQRAAAEIAGSDPSCGLDWTVLAGLGKVESDHGRTGRGSLDDAGLRRPALIGPALIGRAPADLAGRETLPDTDGGQYDRDPRHDRGVGPLRLLPSTWSAVQVDGDGDGVRDPQDIDDAALASAAYLCSGSEDLRKVGGRRSALQRYNPAPGYDALVLGWARAYESAATELSAVFLLATRTGPVLAADGPRPMATKPPAATRPGQPAKPVRAAPTPTPTPAPTPTSGPTPAEPDAEPLTLAQAQWLCVRDGLSPLLTPAKFRECVDERMHPSD